MSDLSIIFMQVCAIGMHQSNIFCPILIEGLWVSVDTFNTSVQLFSCMLYCAKQHKKSKLEILPNC